jgi:hypothetical protein
VHTGVRSSRETAAHPIATLSWEPLLTTGYRGRSFQGFSRR